MNRIIIFGMLLLLLPFSFAHLDEGQDKVVGDYYVDFGYSPSNPAAGKKVTLSFNLLEDASKKVVVPENVWLRISGSEGVVFTGTFKPEANHVLFTHTFPKGDTYEITVRFREKNIVIAETDFELKIIGAEKSTDKYTSLGTVMAIIEGILLVILLIFLFLMRKHKL